MDFRKDINGLRALAVLPVLFFHADWELFSGGFLGVDVFFVISGFLITSLILRDLEAGSFSILSFYDRRARRILPALVLTCALTTALSFFFMLPYDLKNYGQSLVATMLSANNILLYLTSGYWSLAAEFKPLYHTWSLAVEEQYYLAIPALILLTYKISKNRTTATTLILTGILIASYCISLFSYESEFNFLIVSHRMWELLSGSLTAILMARGYTKKSNLMAFAGLLMICFSYVMPYAFSKNQAIYNMIPVFGTVLIIIFSSDNLPIGRLLSSKPLHLVGLLSYSIYLLHMPILAFLRLSYESRPSMEIQISYTLLSIPLAYLSWRYVENTFRDRKTLSNRMFYALLSTTSILLILSGLLLNRSYGLQSHSMYDYGNNPQKYADFPYSLSKKSFTDSRKQNLLIVGNSFARDFTNMMVENKANNIYEIIYLYDIDTDIELSKRLVASADITITVSSAGIRGVVNIEDVEHSSKTLIEFLNIHSNGNYLRIGTKNFGYNNNFVKMKSSDELANYRVQVNESSLTANRIEKSIWGERYVDIIEAISSDNRRVPLLLEGKYFISFDTEHITKKGAIYLGKTLLEGSNLNEYIKIGRKHGVENEYTQ